MVRKCEQAVKAQAEQRTLKGKSDPSVNLHKGRATQELGAMAGVSPNSSVARLTSGKFCPDVGKAPISRYVRALFWQEWRCGIWS